MFNADCCVCAIATAVQLHEKWSCKHKSQLQTAQRLMFLLTVSERSLWYDAVFENTYFMVFFQISKKHDFLRFFEMTYQKVVKSL